jgi:DNA-directed RNA polymerase subunit H (RpoH/RPB5)
MNNQKQTSFTVSKIYKSRKHLLDILEKRGFDVSEYSNFGINEIQAMYLNKQLDMLLKKKDKKDNKQIYVKYHVTNKSGSSTFPKLRDTHINEYIDDLFNLEEILNKDDELLIIIKDQNINKTLEEYMNFIFIKDNHYINILKISELLFNILEHCMVPEHKILSEKEKEKVYERYMIMEDRELPEISRFDPVAKALGLKPGELCEITRSSKTSITSRYYRLCS